MARHLSDCTTDVIAPAQDGYIHPLFRQSAALVGGMGTRLSIIIAILLASLSALALAQQNNEAAPTFNLGRPSPSPSTQPQRQGPEIDVFRPSPDADVTVPPPVAPTVAPAPVTVPPQRPQTRPAARRPDPTNPTGRDPEPRPVTPAPAAPAPVTTQQPSRTSTQTPPPAEPAPIQAAPTPPDPMPAPAPTSTITPPPARQSFPWPWIGGGAALLIAIVALAWARRRRLHVQEAETRPAEAVPEPVPTPTPPARKPMPPAAPVTVARPQIRIRLAVESARFTLLGASIAYRLTLDNEGAAPAQDILVHALIGNAESGADAGQQALLQQFFGGQSGSPLHSLPAIASGESQVLIGELRLAADAIVPIEIGKRALLIPLIAFDVHYRWEGEQQTLGGGRTGGAFIVGQEQDPPGERLSPFRLDLGSRQYRGATSRPTALSFTS
jgi:hypothetical protein